MLQVLKRNQEGRVEKKDECARTTGKKSKGVRDDRWRRRLGDTGMGLEMDVPRCRGGTARKRGDCQYGQRCQVGLSNVSRRELGGRRCFFNTVMVGLFESIIFYYVDMEYDI